MGSRKTVFSYILLISQVLGICVVFTLFQLESSQFTLATQMFLLGAVVSWILPHRFKLQTMTATSILGLFVLFDLQTGFAILGVSLFLIALCITRLPLWVKLAGIALVGLALLQWRKVDSITSMALTVAPVIGTIFMLRVLSYLREVKRNPALAGLKETLAFFLILPNYVMWFFPLIDYKNFIDGSSRPRDLALLRSGTDWIIDGMIQLLLYKVLQAAFYHPFEYVHSYGEYFAFLFINYLNYIRISGAFHIVTGAICLYGVELPRTHRLYMFSASCAEVGRRLNSYWKDFMAWNFYRPCFDQFKHWGKGKALTISILVVFTISCLMHEYIYLWSRGTFALRLEDVLFWSGVGVWAGLDIYFELKAKQKGQSGQRGFLNQWWRISLCLFLFSVIWAVWNSNDVGDLVTTFWLAEWRGFSDLAWVLVFPLIGLLGALYKSLKKHEVEQRRWWRDIHNFAVLGFALVVTFPQIPHLLQLRPAAARTFSEVLDPKFQPEFEAQTRKHSYYDGLKNSDLTVAVDEDERPIDQQPYFEPVTDYRRRRLTANVDTTFMHHRFRTNRWRMNDERDYQIKKKPETLRVALMSASNSMAYGVQNGKQWPRRAEEFLKRKGLSSVEILNFSVIGYSALVIPWHFEQAAARFKPDIVLYAGGARELWLNAFNASTALRRGLTLPYPEELLPLLHLKSADGFLARHYMIGPSYETASNLFRWGINKLADQSRSIGAKPVYMITPMKVIATTEELRGNRWDEINMMQVAREAGYSIIDLGSALDHYSVQEVTLMDDPENYNHFNEKGHEIVAKAFSEAFAQYIKTAFSQKLASSKDN